MSIDRINVNGDYEPTNCRWASIEVQSNNKRTNVRVEYGGLNLTLAQWARKIGINYKRFHKLHRVEKIPLHLIINRYGGFTSRVEQDS